MELLRRVAARMCSAQPFSSRRPRESGDPGAAARRLPWVPAFAGTMGEKWLQAIGIGSGGRKVLLTLSILFLSATGALAEEAQDWQLGMQPGVTPVRARIDILHDYYLLPIIAFICALVLGLLLVVIVRFNAKRHPTPSKTTHNPLLEVFWTVVPALVLIVIAFPSFRLLYYTDRAEKADLTLKVTGHQWAWTYEYPDQGLTEVQGSQIDSNLLVPEDEPVKPGQHRLLDVDEPAVLPVGAVVRILITSQDVIHSWFVPPLGVQEYAVVGRNNETWAQIEKPGTYYGQCNQICGVGHPLMPIEIKAVSKDEFDQWVASKKKKAQNHAPKEEGTTPRFAAQATK
jgi:cytochrome c oxidase subunit 2